jgi:hypothetical protein
MKRLLFALAGGLTVLAAAAPAHAAPVEADPNKEYVLTPEVGPYVICAKGYMGANAHELARRLVLHLRRHGFPAYVYDYSEEERRKARETLEERYKMAPELARHKTIRVEEQWGVLVGGYKDFDGASKDVPKVKKLEAWKEDLPKSDLDIVPDMSTGRLYAMSPCAYAFATRNPLVPQAKPDPNAPDPAWKTLNDGRPYNLLKCGKPWTLAVKQFQGLNVIQPRSTSSKFLDALWGGGKEGDLLDASAKQAEEVARALRVWKFDAWVLHTRGASIVTVGRFDGPEDPKLLQAQNDLKVQLGKIKLGSDARTIEMFQFFPLPLPMKVPQL